MNMEEGKFYNIKDIYGKDFILQYIVNTNSNTPNIFIIIETIDVITGRDRKFIGQMIDYYEEIKDVKLFEFLYE